jgi:hypothetical protein
MSAAAPRTAQETPDMRRVGVAIGALTLAIALVVAGTAIRQAGTQSVAVPAHAQELSVGGYTGIPYTPSAHKELSVGGYTGIPYTPSAHDATPSPLPALHGGRVGSNGTRFPTLTPH